MSRRCEMFHSFHVAPEHQNFLRFFGSKDNDPTKEIVENEMTVYLLGNGPSPAIATFGLRKTADDGEEKYGKAARDFVHSNFYVDDRLTSRGTESETISLVKNVQAMLATANLRLHEVSPTRWPSWRQFQQRIVLKVSRTETCATTSYQHNDRLESIGTLRRITSPSTFHCQKSLSQEEEFFSTINSVYHPLGTRVPSRS